MIFHDLTVTAGSVHSRRIHDTATLVPEAVAVFAGLLARNGPHFNVAMPVPGFEQFMLSFTTEKPGAALATFCHGRAGYRRTPLTTSALVSGRNRHADRECLEQLHELSFSMFVGSEIEPGFELPTLTERPLLATLILPTAPLAGQEVVGLVADLETCLAGAYFLSLQQGG